MPFRISPHSSGLNLRLPSLSNKRSLRTLSGSSPIALKNVPTDEKRLSKWFLS
ncbi:hypothetical protein FIBSPDRAFT_876390 [Athelia psychrophila]|uniref:Uncharacterized protein n=1 Tax=Athelia psychrophila TaxID=1759441 RepID=A0A167WY23_9AGAM|nr:hypothetical protein FIBSPDRAFT_876390 [Fibularhizoctonia sp. CBS 109695]